MKRELLPLKTRIKYGIIFGTVHATIMALFDLADKEPFSIGQFIFYFFFMGFFMSLVFRHKYIKE